MLFRDRVAAIVLLCVTLAASGCINGQSRDIPPAPTAAPGGAAVFVYVAQANDPVLGTNGGAVAVYKLGSDGFLLRTKDPSALSVYLDGKDRPLSDDLKTSAGDYRIVR